MEEQIKMLDLQFEKFNKEVLLILEKQELFKQIELIKKKYQKACNDLLLFKKILFKIIQQDILEKFKERESEFYNDIDRQFLYNEDNIKKYIYNNARYTRN